jgi:hypothetical protein
MGWRWQHLLIVNLKPPPDPSGRHQELAIARLNGHARHRIGVRGPRATAKEDHTPTVRLDVGNGRASREEKERLRRDPIYTPLMLLAHAHHPRGTQIIRKSVFESVGPFDRLVWSMLDNL